MKSILVPTDFSKCAGNAMTYAVDIARHTGAEIVVLHVVFPSEGVDNNVYNIFWSDEYLTERTKGLENWVRRFRKLTGAEKVSFRMECVIGFPVPSICDMADKIHADLIVMGTTGATGLRGVFLGSIAAGVMAKTQRPVLAIPAKAVAGKKENAVFSTDFRFKADQRSIEVLREILAIRNSLLHVVHIMDKPGEEVDKAREHAFSEKLGNVPRDFHYLHDRDIAQAVSNFIEATDAGMLVAVAHEHSVLHQLFFDSITRRLAHRIHVPMLILHDGGKTK